MKKRSEHVAKATKELGDTLREAASLASGVGGAVNEVSRLRDNGYGGAGDSLVRLGVAMVMFPEPFMVTDIAGGGVIAAGLLYNHVVPPPLYGVFRYLSRVPTRWPPRCRIVAEPGCTGSK